MTQTTTPVQAVVFDMAGTTVDEGKTVYRCVQESLAAFGFAYTLKEVIDLIGGMNKREAICLLMNRKNANTKESQVEEVFSHFKQKVEEAYRTDHRIKEKAGATELFRYLKSAGIKVTLDTGYYRSTADILIRKMGWQKEDLIDFSVTSDEVKQGRPAPYMIQKMMAHYGFTDPARIVKVGDTRSDIEEGHNAGCLKVVGITSEQYKKQDLLSMGATHGIAELGELKGILSQQA